MMRAGRLRTGEQESSWLKLALQNAISKAWSDDVGQGLRNECARHIEMHERAGSYRDNPCIDNDVIAGATVC